MEFGNRLALDYGYEEFKNKVNLSNLKDLKRTSNEKEFKSLPFLFGSECPGWTCYAEKKEGDFVIPYMSKIKSPQQIQGNILKNMISSLLNIVNSKLKIRI